MIFSSSVAIEQSRVNLLSSATAEGQVDGIFAVSMFPLGPPLSLGGGRERARVRERVIVRVSKRGKT
jgi:hypothetical protein